MKRIATLILFFTITIITSAQGYQNPIIPGMAPDPSICRVGSDYYLVTSSFIHNPAIPIYHSNDLVNWELINYAVTNSNGLNLSKGEGMYAPTIRYNELDSTFYVICTNVGNGQNFIVNTKDPYSTWSNPVWLTNPRIGIDPSLFWDKDGSCYLQCTGDNNIIQIVIDPKTGEELSSFHYLTDGLGGRYPEGPHMYLIDNYYYLMISEGGTEFGHHVNIFRSDDIWGPFISCPSNPILSHTGKNAQNNPIQCTGHADMVQGHDGSWWMVFLATRPIPSMTYPLGRETFLAPIQWNDNNWPIVNGNGTVSLDMQVPTLPLTKTQKNSSKTICYSFTHEIGKEWNAYRIAPDSVAKIEEGELTIPASNTHDAFIGVKQQQYNMIMEGTVTISQWEGEAGICVHHDDEKRYNVAFIRENGKAYIESQCLFNNVHQTIRNEITSDTHSIKLRIDSDKETYKFYYFDTNKENWIAIGQMDTQFLAGGFSGLLVGPYTAKGIAKFPFISISYK